MEELLLSEKEVALKHMEGVQVSRSRESRPEWKQM